ncbi:MAG: type II toxin-antitoxin system HipA family toxin [Solirubrobacteraceae bacterium]|jgi:serine/threonine-protein kinase HipA
MTDTLLVILDDVVAGTVTRLSGGRLRFEYDASYQERGGHTPLSLSMPVQVRSHPDQQINPWLWGLLPDNEQVLRRWGREFHVSASSAFSLLATPIGEDCAGAVRFAPPDELERVLGRTGEVTWLTEDDVAGRLRELREDSTAWLGQSFTGQFSLAGAQAKTALLFDGNRWGVRSGPIPTTHVLKPAIAGLDDHDLNEHLCLDAARRAGLIAARSAIAQFVDETAVVITRYDRTEVADKGIARVHQEDLCQALGVPPSAKYQNEGGPTPARIARLFRDAMTPQAGRDAVRRFADALIWNWLIGGTDAHAKNYSVLLAGNQVRLAPLYDIASALAYGTHERKLRLAMKIGTSYDVYLQRNRWPDAARDLGLDAEALVERARELARIAPDAFADAVSAPDVVALRRELPGRLLDLVADRASRCLTLLSEHG